MTALEIFWFNVGQSSSQLIKYNDFALLVDFGQVNPTGGGEVKRMIKRLQTIFGSEKVELSAVLATHHDRDHIGNPKPSMLGGGIRKLLESEQVSARQIIVRDGLQFKGKEPKKAQMFLEWVESTGLMRIADVGDNLSSEPELIVEVVYVDGKRLDGAVLDDVRGDFSQSATPFGENELGIVLRLKFKENFVYVTGGDIGGVEQSEGKLMGMIGRKKDVESFVAPVFADDLIDAMTVNHHGSKYSTNDNWLEAVKPTVAAISAGIILGHPNQCVLDRLQEHSVQHVFNTHDIGKEYFKLETSDNGCVYQLFDSERNELTAKIESKTSECKKSSQE